MSYLSRSIVWAEMARRKLEFHRGIQWDKIKLWGLFRWSEIRYLLKEGLLITDMARKNKTVWVKPSRKAWDKHIEPLIEKYSLDELNAMAGW